MLARRDLELVWYLRLPYYHAIDWLSWLLEVSKAVRRDAVTPFQFSR